MGEAQRVAIARAVVNRPALILADEPTSALDDANFARALALLLEQAAGCGATARGHARQPHPIPFRAEARPVKLARLALAYLAARPLLTALNVTLLALGVATIAFLLLVTHQAEERLSRDAKPVDLVVGATGSPLQLILSAIFHADVPTGNIGVEEAETVVANPLVASATPIALGDSFRGFRIVGTDASFLGLYDAKVAQGRHRSRGPVPSVILRAGSQQF